MTANKRKHIFVWVALTAVSVLVLCMVQGFFGRSIVRENMGTVMTEEADLKKFLKAVPVFYAPTDEISDGWAVSPQNEMPFETFLEKSAQGIPCGVAIAMSTVEGVACYRYVSYDGQKYVGCIDKRWLKITDFFRELSEPWFQMVRGDAIELADDCYKLGGEVIFIK